MPEEKQHGSKQPTDEELSLTRKLSEDLHSRTESGDLGMDSRFDLKQGVVLADRFVIERPVGRGGTSIIYKATDKVLERTVAVKLVLPQRFVDKNTLIRFQREARAISRLDHPNIIKVLDFGITEPGDPYLVMEWLEGEPLSALIERQRFMSEERMIEVTKLVCNALAHAHERQVLHRDLKPSNIFLSKKDGVVEVKLLDFGVAKILDVDQKLTDTGEVFGSPLYMSPEQCVGERLDARSDIYSLGCCMYEMLAGTPPFMGASVLETLRMQMQETPFSLTLARGDLAHGLQLESVIGRALAKDATERYQSVAELQKDLDNVADLEATIRMPAAVRPSPSAPVRAAKSIPSWVVALIMVALPVIFFAVAFHAYQMIVQAHQFKESLEQFNWGNLVAARSAGADLDLYLQQEHDNNVREWFRLDVTGQERFDQGDIKGAEQNFRAAMQLAEKMPDSRKDPFLVATVSDMIDVLQGQGSATLVDLGTQIKQLDQYKKVSGATGEQWDFVAIEKDLDRLQGSALPDPAALEQLRSIAYTATRHFANDQDDYAAAKIPILKRIDTLVRRDLPRDQELRIRLDSALGDAFVMTKQAAEAEVYYNNSFVQLERQLAAGANHDLVARAEPQAAFYMRFDPPRAIALSEAASQGVKNKTGSDPVIMAETLSLDASVNFAFGRARYNQLGSQLSKNFGLGRDWYVIPKFFLQYDAVKKRMNQARSERDDARLHIARALDEYDQAILLAIKAGRSDVAAQCSNEERKIYNDLLRLSGSGGGVRGEAETALWSELKFSERALPPYRNSADNQNLLLQSLRGLSEGDVVKEPMRGYLQTRANAVAWRHHLGKK